ncbi:isoprenoid synthase domain-containing protein [Mycena rebaudengoi]|nr:isoprenoid synthase domain-containing protein [Mycena rebaudengoi]
MAIDTLTSLSSELMRIPDEQLDVKKIIEYLLDAVCYESPVEVAAANSVLEELTAAVDAEVDSWNADDGNDGKTFKAVSKKAVSVVEYFYCYLSLEEKFAFAMYCWFFFYIDDLSAQPYLEDFQRRMLLGLPQEHIPLAGFQKALIRLYSYWDPVNANSMSCAAMEFVSGTVLEERKEVIEMAVRPSASNWARYLRTKSGMAPGFSSTAFPSSAYSDISIYIQALPDMEEFLCYANDILSFYKEDLAGETMTYVQIRAKTTQKHPKRVLVEMVEEMGDLHRRVQGTLAGHPDALNSWKTLEYGFIGWHFTLERYKLGQLGLKV